MRQKGSNRRLIRYARWGSKAIFLVLFMAPLTYFVSAPPLPVYSAVVGGLGEPLLTVPYGQSVCSIETYAYAQIGPGAWLICPVGGLQTLVTGFVDVTHFLAAVLALLLFLLPVFVLGNVFCGWACPLGTIIDSFDRGIAVFARDLDAKRQERLERGKKNEEPKLSSSGPTLCTACPITRNLRNKFGSATANGIILGSIVGSAILRFPVFCAICPIGVATRGMFNLKAWTTIAGRMMPIILELSVIPLIAVLLSLREKRFFCRKICPVGAALNLAGSVSPLVKPVVRSDRCVMKACPKSCDDHRLDYCGACRVADSYACERACPQAIRVVDGGSLGKCTKCLECFVECERGAVEIKIVGKSDAADWIRQHLKTRHQPGDIKVAN